MHLDAISVSEDGKWVVCGTMDGASVWDGEMYKEVTNVEGGNRVYAVDVSPDSTRFATGTTENEASIWSITTGQRLVGPLQHDGIVTGIRFSPNGEHVATTRSGGSICVFDSHTGDELVVIKTATPTSFPFTPLVWSNDGQKIFAVSSDNKIKSFVVSTGSQLTESSILGDNVESVALAPNGKFIATCAARSILFLDTSTLTQIGPTIEDSQSIWSIAISPDSSYLATGQHDGKIVVRGLGHILHDEGQPDAQPASSSGHDNKLADSNPVGIRCSVAEMGCPDSFV